MDLAPDGMPITPLAKFSPPSGFRFETELQDSPPRRIPPEFRDSPYFRRQRNTVAGVFVTGVLCLICGQVPIFKLWALYVLPFAYLTWIGLGLLVIGAISWIALKLRRGPLRYIEEGVPIVARVRDLVFRPTLIYNGQPTNFAFSAMLEYQDPATGMLTTSQVDSRTLPSTAKNKFRITYHVGDYVTVIYLPSKPAKTLRLYGFLELRSDLGLVRNESAKPASLLKTIVSVAAVFGVFLVLFFNVYAFSKFQPLDLTFAQGVGPFAVGGIVLGGGFLAWLGRRKSRERQELAARNEKARAAGEAVEIEARKKGLFGVSGIFTTCILGFGAILLGGVVGICWCSTANALLDKSKPVLRPVEIVEFWSTTHNGIIREYEIEYRFVGESKTQKIMSTPAQMNQFQTKRGLAEIHAGAFGWTWLKAIVPFESDGTIQ